jgi:hypothetical protein
MFVLPYITCQMCLSEMIDKVRSPIIEQIGKGIRQIDITSVLCPENGRIFAMVFQCIVWARCRCFCLGVR